MKEIARRLFVSLNHDTFYGEKSQHYIVLNDGNYLSEFYASTQEEAIEIFNKTKWGK